MFSGQGFNAFTLDNATGLIQSMVTWQDLPAAAKQNRLCGLAARPFTVNAAAEPLFELLRRFYTTHGADTGALIAQLDSGVVWREPVGRPERDVHGRDAVSALLLAFNRTYDWTSTLASGQSAYAMDSTGAMLSGNNVGFRHTVTVC